MNEAIQLAYFARASARFILFGILCLLATAFAARAEIKIVRSGLLYIDISDPITARDAKQLDDVEQELQRHPLVFLNSEGGEVSIAMKIGRLIRKYDGSTYIRQGSKCYSSCALIFISGVYRSNRGELGLHRPYFASAPKTREEIEKEVPLMLSTIASYISEMRITSAFYQLMVNTDPSNMTVYEGEETEKIVPLNDPVYEEIQIAEEARRYGVTTIEMRRRNQDDERCADLDDQTDEGWQRWIDCEEATKWGLSEVVYRDRKAKASVCNLSAENQASLSSTLFAYIGHLFKPTSGECYRNIMLGRQ